MRGRGAAAHPRSGDRGSPDPRQAGRGELGDAPGAQRFGAGQRLDLGPDAHRPTGRSGRRYPPQLRRSAAPPGRARGRADDPPGRAPGHAHHGPPVRHGTHHRRGTQALAPQGQRRLSPFLRHAGRSRAHPSRRRPLLRGLPPCDRSDRQQRPQRQLRGHQRVRRAEHLDQALGPAPALRGGQARACHGRTGTARARVGAVGAAQGHRLHPRCGGSRPPGAEPGADAVWPGHLQAG